MPGATTLGRVNIEPLFPGVARTTLYANVYLLRTPQGRVLLDTGTVNHAPAFTRLLRAFDPDAVVVSHSHIDHGGSAFLAARLGYPVLAHPLEHARLLGQDHALPYPAGRPRTGRLISRLHPRPGAGQLQAVGPGDTVRGWEVVHLPGHTDGQIGLRRGGVLLAADAVLGHPRTGAHLPREVYNWSHRAALHTLGRVADLDLQAVLPGHGPALSIEQVRARAARDGGQGAGK